MWRLASASGDIHFGALEDGTCFQHLPRSGWRTLITGPVDPGDAEDLIMLATTAAESQGATLSAGPCDFGMDPGVVAGIRSDEGWEKNAPLLLIAFDMAERAPRRQPHHRT